MDDRDLVEQYVTRFDESAFRSLYRRHSPALYGLVLRLSGYRPAEAEEVLQETWIRALQRLGGFRWESSLRTWLSGIAIRCWREFARRQPRPGGGELMEPQVAGSPPDVDLQRAVARLPDGCREVLILHDVEGYTHQEIG